MRPYNTTLLKAAIYKKTEPYKVTTVVVHKRTKKVTAKIYDKDSKVTETEFYLSDLLDIAWPDIMDTYKLIDNPFDDNASYDGKMFETYGKELDYVLNIANNEAVPEGRGSRVWTYMEDDNGELMVSNGYHLVNSLGYLISTESAKNPDEFYYEPSLD